MFCAGKLSSVSLKIGAPPIEKRLPMLLCNYSLNKRKAIKLLHQLHMVGHIDSHVLGVGPGGEVVCALGS